jgi:mRNA-degrading endonuclease RelE of RelBE toxin-antitoxin system
MVTVTLVNEAREQLSVLLRTIALRMEKLLVVRLKQWPHISGVKYLRGDLAGKCRLRTGDYRLQFYVEESKKKTKEQELTDYLVVVEKLGHRDGFYED